MNINELKQAKAAAEAAVLSAENPIDTRHPENMDDSDFSTYSRFAHMLERDIKQAGVTPHNAGQFVRRFETAKSELFKLAWANEFQRSPLPALAAPARRYLYETRPQPDAANVDALRARFIAAARALSRAETSAEPAQKSGVIQL